MSKIDMTICISAIAKEKTKEEEGKEYIVFATDHMITTGMGEFEQEIKKYKELNCGTIAMLSGKVLLFNELLKGAKEIHDYDSIKNLIHENFKLRKRMEISNVLLKPFSIQESELKNFLIQPLQNPFTKVILENILKHTLETSILLIGFKGDDAQICEISEKGYVEFRDIHFHAIGSGSDQALNTLLFQRHHKKKNLKTTIYNVYKAKRNAEVRQGVGKETEILICNGKKVISLTDDEIIKLKDIYDSEMKFGLDKCLSEDLNSLKNFLNNKEDKGEQNDGFQ